MAEFYRQFAFVSSVLAGFAFTFYGTLLMASPKHRVGGWAAFMAVAASVAFLPVTLGTTFSAAKAADVATQGGTHSITPADLSQLALYSMLFLLGVLFLLASFGLSGWMRSRRLGIATTVLAGFGLVATFFALLPFLRVA
jgi:hypothetical protein